MPNSCRNCCLKYQAASHGSWGCHELNSIEIWGAMDISEKCMAQKCRFHNETASFISKHIIIKSGPMMIFMSLICLLFASYLLISSASCCLHLGFHFDTWHLPKHACPKLWTLQKLFALFETCQGFDSNLGAVKDSQFPELIWWSTY